MKWRIVFAVSLSAIFTFVNCTNNKPTAKLTGEDYFKGIFFMRGDFTKKIALYNGIDIYKDIDKDHRDLFYKVQDTALFDMKVINTAFFDGFKRAIESGSNSQIDKALDQAAFLLIRSLDIQAYFNVIFNEEKEENILNKPQTDTSYKIKKALAENQKMINAGLLYNNEFSTNRPEGVGFGAMRFRVYTVAAAVTFAAAVHQHAAVTINAIAAANIIAAVSVVIWKENWIWNDVQLSPGINSSALNELSRLKYEQLVSDVNVAAKK